MSSCEKCWSDARQEGIPYRDMIERRERADKICTPEQQAGTEATKCPTCGRMTIHQHTAECMACNQQPASTEEPDNE